MSVTNVGASPYPTAQPSWLGKSGEWKAGKPDALNAYNHDAVGNAANSLTNKAIGHDVTARGAYTDANPLPPAQAATTPGTGQKVNIIA